MRPKKFQNKTNGVTPRRWIRCCNPKLAALYTRLLSSDAWLIDLDLLREIKSRAEDPVLQKEWQGIKRENKERLIHWVKNNCGIDISLDALYDVQVKRIHEYKR